MAMNYTEASTFETNSWFINRVKIAVSVYTNYLLNAGVEDPLYSEKQRVATQLAQQNASVVQNLVFTLSGDSEVQTAGPAIPDGQLQMIVEKTLQKFYPIQATPALAPGMYPMPLPLPPTN